MGKSVFYLKIKLYKTVYYNSTSLDAITTKIENQG